MQFAQQPALVHSKPPMQARLATVEARIRDLEAELAAAKAEVSCTAHLASPPAAVYSLSLLWVDVGQSGVSFLPLRSHR